MNEYASQKYLAIKLTQIIIIFQISRQLAMESTQAKRDAGLRSY
jgi:hypothetical protein